LPLSLNSEAAGQPNMTETGYYSCFCQHDDIMAHGGPLAYVTKWLETGAQSKQWQAYVEASRQGSLF